GAKTRDPTVVSAMVYTSTRPRPLGSGLRKITSAPVRRIDGKTGPQLDSAGRNVGKKPPARCLARHWLCRRPWRPLWGALGRWLAGGPGWRARAAPRHGALAHPSFAAAAPGPEWRVANA